MNLKGGGNAVLVSRLKEFRKARRMTIKELAMRSQLNESTIARLEQEDATINSLSAIQRVSKALGVPCNILFPDAKGNDIR